jgi:hypothetical protein
VRKISSLNKLIALLIVLGYFLIRIRYGKSMKKRDVQNLKRIRKTFEPPSLLLSSAAFEALI